MELSTLDFFWNPLPKKKIILKRLMIYDYEDTKSAIDFRSIRIM